MLINYSTISKIYTLILNTFFLTFQEELEEKLDKDSKDIPKNHSSAIFSFTLMFVGALSF